MSKALKLFLMIIYALVMFASIQADVGILSFIILFAILPLAVYIYVKRVFPNK